jgi:diketogulonate reductase-like aldo/keto reductase
LHHRGGRLESAADAGAVWTQDDDRDGEQEVAVLETPVIGLLPAPYPPGLPVLGQGTWRMGESAALRREEVATLRCGIDLGVTLIDTAEMYAEGEAECIVAEAINGRRDEVLIVSKVLPENSTRRGTVAACERSLRRLGTDRIDLYLLHWRGSPPLAETLAGFEDLVAAGKIRRWGVSNFDADDMRELAALGGVPGCATNQVLYNLGRRGIEFDLAPWCAGHGVPIMAYSPVEQGRLIGHAGLRRLAEERGVTPAQLALAFVLGRPGTVAIPKASSATHLRENLGALGLHLDDRDRARLDALFPPPRRATPLKML